MDILYKNESPPRDYQELLQAESLIEILDLKKNDTDRLIIDKSEIVFFYKGKLRFFFNDSSEMEVTEGQFLFFPAGTQLAYTSNTDCRLIIFRILDTINLHETLFIKEAYQKEEIENHQQVEHKNDPYKTLRTNGQLNYFIRGIMDCIIDGMADPDFFELKIRELLLHIRFYYSKEDIHELFYFILSKDIPFSEYVRLNWRRYPSASELARSMHLTPKMFTLKFKKIFGKTPYKWIIEAKSYLLYRELTSTLKPFKQIAAENGFGCVAQFTKFCKKELGNTPTMIRFGKRE